MIALTVELVYFRQDPFLQTSTTTVRAGYKGTFPSMRPGINLEVEISFKNYPLNM